jgi:hypothetical protein
VKKMQFGQRRGDVTEIESDGRYLRNFKKGEVKVRFLEETQDWITFREHYLEGKSFPCTQDKDTCPGCNHPDEDVQRASRKYATNIYLVEVEKTLPFRVPVSLAKSMDTRSDKNGGTILNRDYVVMRSGKGLDTEYDVDSDERYALDTKSLLKDGIDINELLEESYNEVWGEKVVEEKPKASSRLGRGKAKAEEPVEEPQTDFPSEADSDDIVIDEDALYEMSVPDLQDLAVKVGLSVDDDASKRDLIRLLLSEAAE